MTTTNTGGPAFPYTPSGDKTRDFYLGEHGMTLRDYFAAKAMQAILAKNGKCYPEDCYAWADDMLKARNDRQANS